MSPRPVARHTRAPLALVTTLGLSLALVAALLAVGMLRDPVRAWKPYTHTWSADLALVDAQDGRVEVAGRSYPLDDRVVAALVAAPEQYRAGVVGPDAFPDLVMGQSVVHPGTEPDSDGVPSATTGDWLTFVLDRAWDAQSDRRYGGKQKKQVLAFAYGFLTHAAGDVWAHTFVNEFAEGVFPALSDVATDAEAAAVALRHIVVEGYVGDATRGFDANPDRQPVGGGVSDDSTPEVGLAAPPDLFVWETFVKRPKTRGGRFGGRAFADRPVRGQPTAERGPLIDGFYDLHASLLAAAIPRDGSLPWSKRKVRRKIAQCVAVGCAIRKVTKQAGRRYSLEWAKDVADGLEHWGRVGESFTLGLFEPEVRRQAQDDICRNDGGEGSLTRASCEGEVSTIDTMLWFLQDQKYLTTKGPRIGSMLGAPDRFLKVWERFRRVMRWVEDRLDFLVPQPLHELVTRVKRWLSELVNDAITRVLGFDLDVWFEALSNPGTFLSNSYDRDLPGPLSAFNEVDLFSLDAHRQVDALLGLDEDVELTPEGRLPDDAELDLDHFSALSNTAVLARMVLMDGAALDTLLTDLLGRPISTYSAGADGDRDVLVRRNVMTRSLDAEGSWLLNIDSDHAWRQDGQPLWCTPTLPGSCEAETLAQPRSPGLNGGTGRMPLWESCVLRPAFRMLFEDWTPKGPLDPFPAYGDDVSPDRDNDPQPPRASMSIEGNRSGDWVGPGTVLRFDAEETGTDGRVFAPEDLHVSWSVDDGPASTGPRGSTLTLPLESGPVAVRYQGGDPCHLVDSPKTGYVELRVDADAPVQRCGLPNKVLSDEQWELEWEVTEDGSGLALAETKVLAFRTDEGTTVVPRGDVLAGYDLGPGYHGYLHRAADAVGNTDEVDRCGVFVSATSASLRANLDTALERGDVDADDHERIAESLDIAVEGAEREDPQAERFGLEQAIDRLATSPSLDPAVAARLTGHAKQVAESLG